MTHKIATTSASVFNENLEKLREVFPHFVRDGQVDFDALQAFLKQDGVLADGEKYGLNWAGKSNAFRAIRTPSTGTLTPQMDESKDWESTENVFIEGDNLEVLKLLQKNYTQKIKMIYIDPPYNTGKDFVYKDNFTQGVADYYEQTGQTKGGIKMTANTEKNGRYHSDWLTMMYPRLFLAKNLLKDDGVIFVSIDDNEVANLRLIMDEIFGEENVEEMIWRKSGIGRDGKMKNTTTFRNDHEYILIAHRSSKNLNKTFEKPNWENEYGNPDSDPRGNYKAGSISRKDEASNPSHKFYYTVISPSGKEFTRQFEVSKEDFLVLDKDKRIYWGKNNDAVPAIKIFADEKRAVTTSSLIDDRFCTTTIGSKEIEEILDVEGLGEEARPKPVALIKKLSQIGSNPDDVIMDFFAGSGTTAHAVMDLNAEDGGSRKWICVQLPETVDEDSEAYKAGYKTIAEISRERIRRAGRKIGEGKGDTGFKSYKLSQSNYRQWQPITEEGDTALLLKQSKMLLDHPLVDGYDEMSVVYEILVKEGYDLNSAIIKVDSGDTNIPWPHYIVGDKALKTEAARSMIITFTEKINAKDLENAKIKSADLFVCFDSALDDTGKVNAGREGNIKTI